MLKILMMNEMIASLQIKEQDIVNAMIFLDINKTRLQLLRDDGWNALMSEVYVFRDKYDILVPKMDDFYLPGKSKRRPSSVTYSHHLRVELFYAIIDLQLQELSNHFDVVSGNLLIEALVNGNLVETYSLVYLVVKLTLILPVATVTVERAFSSMKHIKNELHSSIGDAFLSLMYLLLLLTGDYERRNQEKGYPVHTCYEHHAALAPLLEFFLNNCGDPFTHHPADFYSKDFEVAVLDWFAQLWEIEKDEYWGYITNGGTEGNLHGLWLGRRELLPSGILYASKDSHYSIFKAARMYRIELETINTLVNGEIDYADSRTKLPLNKSKPAIINIKIGTTFKGAIDDLDLVVQTLENCGYSNNWYHIRCDTALCGLILPIIKHEKIIIFKKSIGIVSVSGHKFLGCPMPCGIHITRKSCVSCLSTIEYIASADIAVSGGRNGLTPIFVVQFKQERPCRIATRFENAQYLKDLLHKAGISSMLNEFSITVVFERPCDHKHKFSRRWQLCYLRDMSHVVLMPGITREIIDRFFKDLMQERKKWYQKGKALPPCLADDLGSQHSMCSYNNMDK
ncbi:Histidine decarboxylase [Capsicum annuum]|nr:Histidine decarboxylase [Capsicum annuum]